MKRFFSFIGRFSGSLVLSVIIGAILSWVAAETVFIIATDVPKIFFGALDFSGDDVADALLLEQIIPGAGRLHSIMSGSDFHPRTHLFISALVGMVILAICAGLSVLQRKMVHENKFLAAVMGCILLAESVLLFFIPIFIGDYAEAYAGVEKGVLYYIIAVVVTVVLLIADLVALSLSFSDTHNF